MKVGVKMNIAEIVEDIFEGVIKAELVDTEYMEHDSVQDFYVFNVEEGFACYGLEPGQWYGLAVERSGYWGVHRDTAEVFPVAKREIVSTEWVRI